MSDGRPFWERGPKEENEETFIERVLGSKAFDTITRAKTARKELEKLGPLGSVPRGDRIPLELLNAAIGYTPEVAALIRRARRASTPQVERERRRAQNKRARISRRRNQNIAAQVRRRRQKVRDRRAA